MKAKARLAIALVAFILLVGGGAFAYLRSRPKPVPRYETAKVDRGRIASRVTATGTVSALVTVLVGTQISGRIETIKVDFNSPVKKGQVIATIEPQLFLAARDQARANYASAKANLEKAKSQATQADRQYDRAKRLMADALVSQGDLETAESNAEVARSQIAAAQASVDQAVAALHQAEVNLKYTTIISPIDGVVISRAVDVGQTVAASLQSPTLFTIAQDLTKMQVDTSVAEGDVGKIQEGMKVSFTVDAYPGRQFDGKVRQVRDAATTVQNVVTYDAVIDVDNGERKLKPGMTASVTFTPGERVDVLRVPNAALRYRPTPATGASAAPTGSSPKGREPKTDRKTVWVLRGGTAAPVEIKAGLSDGSLTEVISGDLSEGDAVITEAPTDGAQGGAQRSGGGGGRPPF